MPTFHTAPLLEVPILSKFARSKEHNSMKSLESELKSALTTRINWDSKSMRGEQNEGGERMMTDDNILNNHKALTNELL